MEPLRLIVAVLLFVGAGTVAEAKNLNHLLRGDYAFSGEATCLVSPGGPGGFDADLTPFDPPASFPFITSFSVHGVRTFNGDGTGKIVARTVSISHPYTVPMAPPPHFYRRGGASSSDIETDFTYQVAPDRTFTTESTVVNGTVLTGTRAGQTFTVTNVQVVGAIARDHRTLSVATDEPIVETFTYSNGDVSKRICHRSRILLKLKRDRGDDD